MISKAMPWTIYRRKLIKINSFYRVCARFYSTGYVLIFLNGAYCVSTRDSCCPFEKGYFVSPISEVGRTKTKELKCEIKVIPMSSFPPNKPRSKLPNQKACQTR